MANAGASYMDGLFYRAVASNGTVQPQRPILNFIGLTLADNPSTNSTDATVGGSSFAASFGSISLGTGPFPSTGLIKIGGTGGTKVVLAAAAGSDSSLISYDTATPALIFGNDTEVAAVNTNVPAGAAISLTVGGTNLFVSLDGAGSAITLGVGGTARIKVNTTGTGFFNATPIAKPSVTGSRADPEQALKSLLIALNALGLIANGTTA